MSAILHLIDRSRVVAREECPRLRYLNYDFNESGLESEKGALPLLSGIAIHTAHARLLAGQPLEVVVAEVVACYVEDIKRRGLFGLEVTKALIAEQAALLEGMLRVWYAKRMPMILEEYDIVSIEETWDWELSPGLVQRMRMDVILRRKDDGLLFILDYKTMAYASDGVMEKHEHSHQTCLYLQALKEHFNEPVGGILYEGLIKGKFALDMAKASPFYKTKVQQGPYTMAWGLKGDIGTVLQTEYTPKKGWEKMRPYEVMPVKDWAQVLIEGGQGILSTNELFIPMPPISPPSEELLRMKRKVVREEEQYHAQLAAYKGLLASGDPAAVDYLDLFAPTREERCFKFGLDNRCQFSGPTGICFNQGMEPLAADSGYLPRTAHHDRQLEFVE